MPLLCLYVTKNQFIWLVDDNALRLPESIFEKLLILSYTKKIKEAQAYDDTQQR